DAHALWLDAALRFYLEFDWRGAEREFQRALSLDPNNAAARRTFVWLLLTLGRTHEAEEQARLALQLDPASANASSVLGLSLYCSGNVTEAMTQFAATEQMQSSYSRHLVERGRIDSVLGNFDGALADLSLARTRMGDDPEIL